ncbi:very-long-chain aldehyde decarbonylase CER1-like [Tripterygium wilfordii]|uniref:very-long-chain aldehyde decarbonylase CER1-like n=1 Tax=Tripterygium wilfordii TaxID=458696 RepID=UPI0018F7E4F3|nr:very-long-chain aldehyde decarbonylase CER1-like [Tripterygium wilfordii]
MASKPGILTDWPWKPLGTYKYMIVAPWVVHSTYLLIFKEGNERSLAYFLMLPFILTRLLHGHLWILLSRYRNARGNNRIVDRAIEFDQIDRESSWDDQILFTALLYYVAMGWFDIGWHMRIWRSDGVIITMLLHVGPVEFLYYWLHRALHHHYLYSRYHSHHHSSIVTQPITSVIHPFAEIMAYFLLFSIPIFGAVLNGTASMTSVCGYLLFLDFMNYMGHCNFELFPKWLFSIFPPIKYLIYTPSFHSLHHTQFRTNYCLFMPIYDYIYNTMDKSTDSVYQTSLQRPQDSPDVVHLTHLTTPANTFIWSLWPLTIWSRALSWFYGNGFVVTHRNCFEKIVSQTWLIPTHTIQYYVSRQREAINESIEEAIVEAEERGVKILSLGLLNQGKELNKYGEIYIQKYPKLKTRVVDGNSLAVAVVLNSIPKGTTQVLLLGATSLNKVASALALALCQSSIQVCMTHEDKYKKLIRLLHDNKRSNNLVLTRATDQKVWLIGDGVADKEQLKAPKGTLFIPLSQFPPKSMRHDCFYHHTPAMLAPKSFQNINSCENYWLPRRAMSAWRVAGIVHALENWGVHEVGDTMFSSQRVWQASLQHGFRPLSITTTST